MIYLSILLLLFLAFKGVISNRAAVEKEPLTFEKDKEDSSKYNLSNPKPPVLEMTWANCDINVVE